MINIKMPKVFFSPQDAGIQRDDGVIIGCCERAVAYSFMGTKSTEPLTPVQEIGITFQKYLINKLNKSNNLITHFGRVEDIPVYGLIQNVGRPIFGFADCIVTGDLFNSGVIIDNYAPFEIKSFGIKSVNRVERLPWPRHVIQASIYAYLLKSEQSVLTYVSREDGNQIIWLLDITEDPIIATKAYSSVTGLTSFPPVETEVSMDAIIDRYKYLSGKISSCHDIREYSRDFYLYYPVELADTLRDLGKITAAEHKTAKTSGIIKRGDFECLTCPFNEECWQMQL